MLDAIEIRNSTKNTIEVVTTAALKTLPENERVKKHSIAPGENFVLFTSIVESITWQSPSQK